MTNSEWLEYNSETLNHMIDRFARCHMCGQKFKFGDKIISKWATRSGRRSYYCYQCALKLNIVEGQQ